MKLNFFMTTHDHPQFALKEIHWGMSERRIKRKDIESISYNTNYNCYVVFYWVSE